MKVFTKALFVAVVAMFSTMSASAQSDNSLFGRANAEVGACLAQTRAEGFSVIALLETTGACPDGSSIQTVSFFRTVNCQDTPTRPCPDPLLIQLATVTFGCNGEITSSQCFTE
jgi:hypothetical protein